MVSCDCQLCQLRLTKFSQEDYMQQLSPNWLLEGTLDYEYKNYVLLAYLQQIEKHFQRHRLYPFLTELIEHHRKAIELKEARTHFVDLFPKRLKRVDWENGRLEYESTHPELPELSEVAAILDMALELFEKGIEAGTAVYEAIEKNLQFETIGIVPLEKREGYLLLTTQAYAEVLVYRYSQSIYTIDEQNYRNLVTQFVSSYQRSLVQSLEQIKLQLIKKFVELPNPATFAAIYTHWLPVQSTLLPIAKRQLMRQLG